MSHRPPQRLASALGEKVKLAGPRVMRFRLRYSQHDLELAEGQFAIGRSAGCQLSLDDPLVSRRHAMFTVAPDSVTVEDMQSRNGVLVNGQRIAARTTLRPGDRIVIGSQQLVLLLGRDAGVRDTASGLQAGKRTIPKMEVASRAAAGPPPEPSTGVPGVHTAGKGSDPGMRRTDAFEVLGSVADKALVMGRADEAERLLAAPLADVIEASRAGKALPPLLVDVASRFAAKLATSTTKGSWVDYVIELCDGQGRTCPAAVVDELYSALRKVNAIDLARLRVYVAHLREKQASLGPAEKFLLQRIEGLERLAALR